MTESLSPLKRALVRMETLQRGEEMLRRGEGRNPDVGQEVRHGLRGRPEATGATP